MDNFSKTIQKAKVDDRDFCAYMIAYRGTYRGYEVDFYGYKDGRFGVDSFSYKEKQVNPTEEHLKMMRAKIDAGIEEMEKEDEDRRLLEAQGQMEAEDELHTRECLDYYLNHNTL